MSVRAKKVIEEWIERGDENYPLILYSYLLEEFPDIPDTVKYLVLDDNNISYIPKLPGGLVSLSMFSNHLMELPELPDTLEELLIDGNHLKRLPTLPVSLRILDCRNNELLSYPADGESIQEYNQRLQSMQNIYFLID